MVNSVTAKKVLITNSDLCGACNICELICSFSKDGVFSPTRSRIRLKKTPMNEVIFVCQNCKVTKCIDACEDGALYRDPQTNAIIVEKKRCKGINCSKCVEACPYKSIFVDLKKGEILICDLCGGDPICVKWCPRGALIFDTLTDKNFELKRKAEMKIVGYLRREVK